MGKECHGFDSTIGALSDADAQSAELTSGTSEMGALATSSACSHSEVAHLALDDAALAAAWEYEGEPREYVATALHIPCPARPYRGLGCW